VSTRVFRISVRGAFADLSAAQSAELLAHAAEHDVMQAAFTPEGHVSYDITAPPFFTFRFEADGAAAGDIAPATEPAEAMARAWLVEHGYGFKKLTAQAEDLSDMPLGKRGRRIVASRMSDR